MHAPPLSSSVCKFSVAAASQLYILLFLSLCLCLCGKSASRSLSDVHSFLSKLYAKKKKSLRIAVPRQIVLANTMLPLPRMISATGLVALLASHVQAIEYDLHGSYFVLNSAGNGIVSERLDPVWYFGQKYAQAHCCFVFR